MAVIDIEYGREILGDVETPNESKDLKEMEMTLHNSSYGHQYTVMELQEAQDFLKQEELGEKLESYRQAYFQARQYMAKYNPDQLQAIEEELLTQKEQMFTKYHA